MFPLLRLTCMKVFIILCGCLPPTDLLLQCKRTLTLWCFERNVMKTVGRVSSSRAKLSVVFQNDEMFSL